MMVSGRYYIGDLCYVFNDEQWDVVCSLTIKDQKCLTGEFEFPNGGPRFAMYGTKYGDGSYFDDDGREYGVDSGTIGCVLVRDCDPAKLDAIAQLQLGQFETFDEDFSTSEHNGRIKIGYVEIETNPSDEENDDYFEDDDDED